jgi:gas vesicle protein
MGNNEYEIADVADRWIAVQSRPLPLERKIFMAHTAADRNTVIADAAISFIAGTLLGAGVALLFAPQSGRKTRRDIRQFAEKTGNKVEAAQLELQHSIENTLGDISEKLQEGLSCGIDWTDSKIADLQGALEGARKSLAGETEKTQSI